MEDTVQLLPAINTIDDLHDIFLLEGIESNRKKLFDTYTFNGMPVPRVTTVLDEMINKPFLLRWACSLGYNRYLGAKDFATSIGSKVHELIENFLLTGTDLDINYKKAPKQAPLIDQAYNNFKAWYNRLISLGYTIKIIAIEKQLCCPYYAGTADCIAEINGKIYILDFKTSKKLSFEYFLQLCAYRWIINNGFIPNIPYINGVGLIRVDKERPKYEDLFLNEFIPEQNYLLESYTRGFGTLLAGYYTNINLQYEFDKYKKSYSGLENILLIGE